MTNVEKEVERICRSCGVIGEPDAIRELVARLQQQEAQIATLQEQIQDLLARRHDPANQQLS